MRAIDADALKEDLTRFYDNEVTARKLIDEQPTIQPAQPERIKGRWERDGHHIKCDQCGEWMCDRDREGWDYPKNFCPSCGAKMEVTT